MQNAPRSSRTGWARSRSYLAETARQLAARVTANPKRLNRELRRAAASDGEADLAVPFPLAQSVLGPGLHLDIAAPHLTWQVTGKVTCARGDAKLRHWFVGGGDWKPILRRFDRHGIYREMADLLRLGENFRDSPHYTAMIAAAAKGAPAVRNDIPLDTPERVDAYFERYLGLFDSVRRHGILRMSANRRLVWADLGSQLRSWWQGIREVDIGVAVGADGRIFRLHNAQHRSAIALLLKLPRVPVEVRLVHRDWLRQALAARPELPPAQAVVAALAGLGAAPV